MKGGGEVTSGPDEVVILDARASIPSMSEISWTRAFTSFALVFLDRSWLSFAMRHGCEETWTLGGKLDIVRLGYLGTVQVSQRDGVKLCF
jgi:hypothetical protein